MRTRAKVDANQKKVVQHLRLIGASVQSLASVGCGCPDLLIGYRGKNFLVELKNPSMSPSGRRLTDDEVAWGVSWRGEVWKCETFEEIHHLMDVSLRYPNL